MPIDDLGAAGITGAANTALVNRLLVPEIEDRRLIRVGRHGVSAMQQTAGHSSDVPASPSLIERCPAVDDQTSSRDARRTIRPRNHRCSQQARDVQRVGNQVAVQALHFPTQEPGLFRLVPFDGVKIDALIRVQRGRFEYIPGGAVPDGNLIVEV